MSNPEDPASQGPAPEGAVEPAAAPAPQPRRKEISRARRVASIVVLLLLVLGGVGLDSWRELHRPLDTHDVIVEIESGHAFSNTAGMLEARGVLESRQRLYLILWARASGLAKAVRAGEYKIDDGASALQILNQFVSGRILLHEIRFIEGWTLQQAWALVRNNPDVKQTLDSADPAALMQALGAPDEAAEGAFFPDTYRFPKGVSEVALMRQARQEMSAHLGEAWNTRAPDLPYTTPAEALIMASLVEKEAAHEEERAIIAGVFLRRLKIGMKLQTDPSVIYGLGERYDGNLHLRDLAADTPYNSYTRNGLPPTPICLPGEASIRAALHPADGDALYFVARGDGTHQFSATLAEHNAAVQHYQIEPHRGH